ncbi:MAG: hypothetical protein HY738_10595, partial [Bacteroidia bacterium]|nr:hypothetical protein [Bacteroidia bacterium]
KIFSLKPKQGNYNKNFISSLIFGFVVGSFTIGCNTCCNPVFPVVFGASFIKGSYLWGIFLLTIFGVGFSLPFSALMLGLGTGVAKLSNSFNKITIIIRWIAGLLLIAIGFYILLTI